MVTRDGSKTSPGCTVGQVVQCCECAVSYRDVMPWTARNRTEAICAELDCVLPVGGPGLAGSIDQPGSARVAARPREHLSGGQTDWSCSFLTSVLDRGTRFTPGERAPGTHWTRGWVGPRACLDTEARGKVLCLCRKLNPSRPVVWSVVRHYTA
jgi:hypothetical protein